MTILQEIRLYVRELAKKKEKHEKHIRNKAKITEAFVRGFET